MHVSESDANSLRPLLLLSSVYYSEFAVSETDGLFVTFFSRALSCSVRAPARGERSPRRFSRFRQPGRASGGYSWKGMPLPAIFCLCLSALAHVADAPLPPVRLATFGVGDTLLIVVVALIVFGPKKLPEISRQVGKLLYEFRKASNDFKFQIEEELRAAEQAERQKELSAQAAVSQPATPVAITAGETVSAEPVIEGVRTAEDQPKPYHRGHRSRRKIAVPKRHNQNPRHRPSSRRPAGCRSAPGRPTVLSRMRKAPPK